MAGPVRNRRLQEVEPKRTCSVNDRVFTSRLVYKLKRSATTGEVYRFKARLIIRGFQMKTSLDFDDSFSPTPGLAIGRFMLSLALATIMSCMHATLNKLSATSSEMRRTAECGRCADQKPSASSPCQTSAIHVGHCIPVSAFYLSLKT